MYLDVNSDELLGSPPVGELIELVVDVVKVQLELELRLDYADNDDFDAKDVNDDVDATSDLDYATQSRGKWSHKFTQLRRNLLTTSPPLSLLRQLKRVPRQQQQQRGGIISGSDNRLDTFHEAGYQSDQPVGAITAEKQQAVGTQKNVQESFRQFQDMDYKNNQNIMRILVTLHRSSMETEPLCRLPQPRIIRMDTDPSNTYSPPFTKLHRCDKNSSCCSHLEVWRVKSTAIVELPFFVSPMHGRIGRNMMIPFINHTECHCASSTPQRTKRSNLCQCPKHFTNFGREPDQPIRGTFDPVATSCRCDCHLNDSTCQRMKNGAEGFGIDELRCIRNQECSPPICTYGAFILASGRCPRAPPRPLGFG
ncbi:uncharacterized protein LOC6562691 [Drosophila grimshawi]|uniref:uncharacterized protein LOC6562691 n=1 Tax=Drosophila grimshawi TaxID=7222 RepID=UPI0013EEF9F1|nr:uncharacterized protein LOC6562691 [Drosophila grimshawi]